jgi:hypothetical protein
MKKPYFVIIFLLGLTILLSMGKAILQNALSTSGIYLSNTQKEISYYKTQNAILSEELLTASSLTAIAQKANEAGFIGGNNLMVVKTSIPLAAKP